MESTDLVTKTLKNFSIINENVNQIPKIECSVQQLAAIIKTESRLFPCASECNEKNEPISQTLFNVAVRTYFELLKRENVNDEHLSQIPLDRLTYKNERGFQLHYALILAEPASIDPQRLIVHLQNAMTEAINANANSILVILKTINLLCKKYAELDIRVAIPLKEFYHCLQNCGQNGMREETLKLFQHCIMERSQAEAHFRFIIDFWPWTNRNKYYLLSVILKVYKLNDLFADNKDDLQNFFSGLRISLNYKSLLAASQYLVKSLSNQDSKELLDLALNILTHGTLKELQNFYSQWFLRINQKDTLFEMLQGNEDVLSYLESGGTINGEQTYRLILIVNMFPRQLYETSKLHFFKISTELLMNCFEMNLETQWLIFKFITENVAYFAFEDCLEFISGFLDRHKNVDDAQHRNKILGKMPSIINFISKTFGKLCTTDCSAHFYETITHFFQEIHNMINIGITSDVYQPKIFSLKLLEILLCSLYAKIVQKNSKNCSILLNQQLGLFLQHQQIFDSEELEATLVRQLCDPLGFDDTHELMIGLLKELNYKNTDESGRLCREFCMKSEIDECAISGILGRVAINSCKAAGSLDLLHDLYDFSLTAVTDELEEFQKDPLLVCKTKYHLYGHLAVINEIVIANLLNSLISYETLITLINRITTIVLEMLSMADTCKQQIISAASFQDMDASLEMLVQQSSYDGSANEPRKFLLMSFWLTLKICCELAANIGSVLSTTTDIQLLEQCLWVNEAVLTRCRHKGAIEAAGITIGKLTKNISGKYEETDKAYRLLYDCLDHLFDNTNVVSTTRRGAGYSIMLLHLVKNDEKPGRPILMHALKTSLMILNASKAKNNENIGEVNCDRIETLVLHYLCVLVKDTELRDAIADHYDEIMMAAMVEIDNCEWTICNAALQLFGALVPKIVGQRQATEYDEPIGWEPVEISYGEIIQELPQVCKFILNYCRKKQKISTSTRSIILFLSFLCKVEHLNVNSQNSELLQQLRDLMWELLHHNCEKVRKLAAMCFICMHEFRIELPLSLLKISNILFSIQDENLFQGLIFTLYDGFLKLKCEAKCVLQSNVVNQLHRRLNENISRNYKQMPFKLYTLCNVFDLLELLKFDIKSREMAVLLEIQPSETSIGYNVWLEKKQTAYGKRSSIRLI